MAHSLSEQAVKERRVIGHQVAILDGASELNHPRRTMHFLDDHRFGVASRVAQCVRNAAHFERARLAHRDLLVFRSRVGGQEERLLELLHEHDGDGNLGPQARKYRVLTGGFAVHPGYHGSTLVVIVRNRRG